MQQLSMRGQDAYVIVKQIEEKTVWGYVNIVNLDLESNIPKNCPWRAIIKAFLGSFIEERHVEENAIMLWRVSDSSHPLCT